MGFAVLGCQLHQQSRREWYGLEPRVTRRDEWSVASLALGPFFRVDPVLHPQLANSDWLVPCQGTKRDTVPSDPGKWYQKEKERSDKSYSERDTSAEGMWNRPKMMTHRRERETVPRHSPQKALLTLQTSCFECALYSPLRHRRKQTGTFGFAWVVTCSWSYLKNTPSRRVIVLPISKCKWQGWTQGLVHVRHGLSQPWADALAPKCQCFCSDNWRELV